MDLVGSGRVSIFDQLLYYSVALTYKKTDMLSQQCDYEIQLMCKTVFVSSKLGWVGLGT